MMVTFVSQCQKKALARTRRVLDAFANRIGDNTWQTVITEEGLIAVKTLLRKTATKNTAVSCHWIRSRSRSELVWIVGNRKRFNAEGVVPVNSTQKNLLNSQWENNWTYLPAIKALVAVAALLHDWGKATALFQSKLKSSSCVGDPLRHEWISCLLLNGLVRLAGDEDKTWLRLLGDDNWDEAALKNLTAENLKNPLADLPPIAQLVGWLIMSHHRLPSRFKPNDESGQNRESLARMLKSLNADWGYQNPNDDDKRLKACFEFPDGLLSQSDPWRKQLKKWSAKLLQNQVPIQALLDNGAYRLLLHHARLCLMLGDHYYSSCQADGNWQSVIDLYANTDSQKRLKQKLDEHLVRVGDQALKISQTLSRFSSEMDAAYDIKSLKQKSPAGFEWQDKAVDGIARFKAQHQAQQEQGYGWFVVNMASTGCGKTVANAKVMRALADDGDSLRYVLALGLRTLTLQTGNEYRNRLGLTDQDLAVLIGSAAIKQLYDKAARKKDQPPGYEDIGSESREQLLAEDLDFGDMPHAEFLDVLFPKHQPRLTEKHKAFLYKPVLACTIDHIIVATETRRGGKFILPCLRLLSSDLVIDEVDDFDGTDLIAIGRLIHLAGMLGRKVMISSATIPPDLAEGFFHAYQAGWQLHSHFKTAHPLVACAWIDEFGTQVERLDNTDSDSRCRQYAQLHRQFIGKRVGHLHKQLVKRKAIIERCDELLALKSQPVEQRQQYFAKIRLAAERLHADHHSIDAKTGKRVSFGVVRMANIPPCVALTRYMLQAEWGCSIEPKIMAYHSRQVLLIRHEQEKHLDEILQRKEKPGQTAKAFQVPAIRRHLDSTAADDVLFILVATPVEEVGRDHDFDWAVIEPSSFRSIIQLAGRVLRHRRLSADIEHANIAVMQYNLKALRQSGGPAYCRPGYENGKSLRLTSHDFAQLVDEAELNKVVNAVPRIQRPEKLEPKQRLADLEHQALHQSLTDYRQQGPQALQAWLHENWWLTAVPQQINPFRAGNPETSLFLVWRDGKAVFCEKDERGQFIPRQSVYNIVPAEPFSAKAQARSWMTRDYQSILRQHADSVAAGADVDPEQLLQAASERYGEIMIRPNSDNPWFYSDQFGLYQDMN
ncbi:type I-F CRISPR-associated helicase Cas3f [Methylomonas sp. MED-D]|uniref:Type I-F CRISPR-associated helicase Cas3 n=1 Tax=Methylomonas koyamae TaxID=702114 RepID=A0A177PE96_9GAMM|nr:MULTISPECIES: type I-F CRISPR-associated helicase Cas3f [Methylomonas]MDT4331138.1 type I-F CRISPR-associated helicase Cas3f [Methylomonas sp. MV1]OAI27680.1 type I-F CRISPR-associated helicase Cas3 [Methylomonas koyamae]